MMVDWMPLLERLEWALARAEITKAQLADHLAVSRSAVTQWGRETKQITPEHLFPAARFLSVEPEWLGTGHGPRTRTEAAALSALRPDAANVAELVSAIAGLKPAVRTALLSLVRAIDG